MAFNPGARQFAAIKATLFIVALLPFARLIVGVFLRELTANPTQFITRNTGSWTLIFLCITLAVTPLRRLTGMNWLVRLRRMFGLYTFFYGLLHFLTFFVFDHYFDLGEMWADVLKRPFITVGFSAFVLLVPLALTSFNAAIRWMGAKRWQALHKVIYAIAGLAMLHFWWMRAAKSNFNEPIIYGVILALLLGFRVFWRIREQRKPVITPPRKRMGSVTP